MTVTQHKQKRNISPLLWLGAACALLLLFALLTAALSNGSLFYPTMRIEQWLLHRPLTAADCVFYQWKLLGEAPASLVFAALLGLLCIKLGYRRRVALYLVALLLIGVGIELIGKNTLYQPVPFKVQNGLNALACPQMRQEPYSMKLLVGLGLWWEAPPAHPRRVKAEQAGAAVLLVYKVAAYASAGYPSGHALRWCFLGLVACWLIWRWVRHRLLRALLMALALAVAFGGGYSMFYIGQHLASDLLGGYLLGAALACCAIALLLLHERRGDARGRPAQPAPEQDMLKAGI